MRVATVETVIGMVEMVVEAGIRIRTREHGAGECISLALYCIYSTMLGSFVLPHWPIRISQRWFIIFPPGSTFDTNDKCNG